MRHSPRRREREERRQSTRAAFALASFCMQPPRGRRLVWPTLLLWGREGERQRGQFHCLLRRQARRRAASSQAGDEVKRLRKWAELRAAQSWAAFVSAHIIGSGQTRRKAETRGPGLPTLPEARGANRGQAGWLAGGSGSHVEPRAGLMRKKGGMVAQGLSDTFAGSCCTPGRGRTHHGRRCGNGRTVLVRFGMLAFIY